MKALRLLVLAMLLCLVVVPGLALANHFEVQTMPSVSSNVSG